MFSLTGSSLHCCLCTWLELAIPIAAWAPRCHHWAAMVAYGPGHVVVIVVMSCHRQGEGPGSVVVGMTKMSLLCHYHVVVVVWPGASYHHAMVAQPIIVRVTSCHSCHVEWWEA